MKLAASMLFCLLLLPLAHTANASPEQEMEAKAREIMPIVFSKCGEDYCLRLGGAKPPPLGGSFSRFCVDWSA